MTQMEQAFKQLKEELDKKSGHKLDAEFDAMTKERSKKLETLHEDIAKVHKATTDSSGEGIANHIKTLEESNQRTLNNLDDEHRRMFGVSIFAIAFIIIAGLSLYNKFRCWEKKH